jgi:predicted ester cyclase
MGPVENKKVVERLFDEVWNGRNLDVIDDLYSARFVADYRPYAPLREGRQAVRDMVEAAYATFPDYHEDLLAMVAEGDRVAVHSRICGTQLGPWGPVPAAGRRLEFEEFLLLTFDDDGRVGHQRGIPDNLLGLRQTGLLRPTPDDGGS